MAKKTTVDRAQTKVRALRAALPHAPPARSAMTERLLELLKTRWHWLVLGSSMLLCLAWLYPEVIFSSIFYNDGVSHISIVRAMDETWKNGGNITDFWMDNINFGHALLRSYQFLLHLIVWVVHKTLLSPLPVEQCFNVCIVIMAMALPLAFYKGARLFGLARLEAVIASVAMILVHEREGYGVGLTNYTFSGYGLYNQLLATSLFMLTIGYARTMLRAHKRILVTSILFSLTFMSHIMAGYMAAIWIALDAVIIMLFERDELLRGWLAKLAVTLGKFAGLVLLWTGHWLIPMAREGLYQRHTTFDMPAKFLGHGAEKVLTDLWTGLVLDADRIPVLTILGGLGLAYCLTGWFRKPARDEDARSIWLQRQLSAQTLVWILLSFGPATWGSLTRIFPFSSQMHWHRFVAGVEITMVLCAGVSLGVVWRWLTVSARPLNYAAGAILFAALLAPCLRERQTYFYTTNLYWLEDTYEAWTYDTFRYHLALEFMQTHPKSRYYVGDPIKNRDWAAALKISKTIPWYALAVQFNVSDVGSIHNHQNHTETLAYNIQWDNQDSLELGNIGYVGVPASQTVPHAWVKVLSTANATLYSTGVRPSFFGLGYLGPSGCADNDILARSISYFVRSPLLARHVYPAVRLSKTCEGEETVETSLLRSEKLPFPSAPPGEIVSTNNVPGPNSNTYTANVRMNTSGLLLFKMNFHPGWVATVDGERVNTMMVIPSFIGIRLLKGDHQISMEYQVSPSKGIVEWLVLAGIIGAVGTLLYFKIRSPKRILLRQSKSIVSN